MDIKIKGLEHVYQPNTPFEKVALDNINIDIPSGTFLSVIGHTGSGKSTLIQHFNGLLRPTGGSLTIGDRTFNSTEKLKDLKALRRKVGIVFQYPEHQLFEETVEKDICFAPMNFGVSERAAKEKAREVIKLVGLPEEVLHHSPFDLSGGQMRRVAIAGVLAMDPEVIILDEPTAGLDPKGQKEIMRLFKSLHLKNKLSIIHVTHSMEDAALYANKIVVMHKGTVYMQGSPAEVFAKPDELNNIGVDVPETVKFLVRLEEKLNMKIEQTGFSLDDLVNQIDFLLKRGENI